MDPQDKAQNGTSRPQPTSAPKVPRELLSARPAMTRVVPRSPEKMAQLNQEQQAGPKPELTPEELAERQERIEYLKNLRQKESRPRKSSGKKWLIVVLVLLLLAGLGAAAYWFLLRPTAAPVTTTSTQSTQKQNSSAAPAPSAADDTKNLKDHQSTNFNVSFKYPSDWVVSDTAQKLTLTSPQSSLSGANGKVNGQVIMTIRPKQTALDEFKAGNATAVLDSKKVSYSQPAPGQRDSTYLSYLQYAKTTTKGALDAVYVTGNAGYQKGQAVPQADVVKVDPLITVSFVSCSATCTTTAPAISVNASDWVASDSGKTIETVLKSLAIN